MDELEEGLGVDSAPLLEEAKEEHPCFEQPVCLLRPLLQLFHSESIFDRSRNGCSCSQFGHQKWAYLTNLKCLDEQVFEEEALFG